MKYTESFYSITIKHMSTEWSNKFGETNQNNIKPIQANLWNDVAANLERWFQDTIHEFFNSMHHGKDVEIPLSDMIKINIQVNNNSNPKIAREKCIVWSDFITDDTKQLLYQDGKWVFREWNMPYDFETWNFDTSQMLIGSEEEWLFFLQNIVLPASKK